MKATEGELLASALWVAFTRLWAAIVAEAYVTGVADTALSREYSAFERRRYTEACRCLAGLRAAITTACDLESEPELEDDRYA